MLFWLAVIVGLLSAAGCCYLVVAALLIHRFVRRGVPASRTSSPGVTILKPLHGAAPGLAENITSFCIQNYPGPTQIVFGVQDLKDEAIPTVERLRARYAASRLDLVIDVAVHGLNRKVSNLINMWGHVEHEIVVVSDSDIRVNPKYLSRIIAALEQPGVGAVTCLYHGFATAGVWSRLAALGINAHFLPNVIVGLKTGLARPCFGSTIAFRRKTFAEIGEFIAVANCLADDYAIGAALRACGYEISIPPFTVGHACAEMSALEFWQHEVRWARTIRSIDPIGYAGSIVAHAFALALIAALAGVVAGSLGPVIGIGLCVTALLCRVALLRRVEQAFALPPQPYWLVPVRDLLSFAVFLWSCLGRNARWKDHRYQFSSGGTLVASRSSSTS
jgi:ceramide glucosyltransferase